MIIGMEKVDIHREVTVKALLDSKAMEIFADRKFIENNGFKLEKLDKVVKVRNVDGMKNSRRTIVMT